MSFFWRSLGESTICRNMSLNETNHQIQIPSAGRFCCSVHDACLVLLATHCCHLCINNTSSASRKSPTTLSVHQWVLYHHIHVVLLLVSFVFFVVHVVLSNGNCCFGDFHCCHWCHCHRCLCCCSCCCCWYVDVVAYIVDDMLSVSFSRLVLSSCSVVVAVYISHVVSTVIYVFVIPIYPFSLQRPRYSVKTLEANSTGGMSTSDWKKSFKLT